jgi:Zn-dependent metalloprotease
VSLTKNWHNPIHCIVPDTMLKRVAQKGNDRQRDWALQTMTRSHSMRSARLQNAQLRRLLPSSGFSLLGPETGGQPRRTIADAENTETLPGKIVRYEGGPATGDEAADEAYDGLGATYNFFWDCYQRDSIDDSGLPLDATVHYGQDYDNAFWDGVRMVFGDGDGELFNRFTLSLDVIGHELGHGVTEDEAGLVYFRQSGALNESMSDVFGSLVKQYKLGQTADQADWLIGAELLGPEVEGIALRSMKDPGSAYDDDLLGKDPQPGHMDDYVQTSEDNGGVHINSGIPNRAFYTVATTLGGKAWERAGLIWYEALRDPRIKPGCRFRGFARATLRAAGRLFGDGGDEMKAVQQGWETVGVEVVATSPS